MTQRLTLPQRRAQETRQKILEAASRVFGRRGYGQATVEDIANEAEISIGALYHHFSGKEELFKELLADHVRTAHHEFEIVTGAASFRELVEQIAAFWLGHLKSEHEFGDLFLEFSAEATRNPWAREIVSEHQRKDLRLIEGMIRIGQTAGVIRSELDSETAAILIAACLQGIELLQSVDPQGIDLGRLRRPLADLIERFLLAEGESSTSGLPGGMHSLIQHFAEHQKSHAPTKEKEE